MAIRCWVIAAGVLILAAYAVGMKAQHVPWGILIDERGRMSLSRLQVTLWTILVISLWAGVACARIPTGHPLDITLPPELLWVMGISVGSATTAGAIKAHKERQRVPILERNHPHWAQIILEEEGDKVPAPISIGKFQNFWITLLIAVGYIVSAVTMLRHTPPAAIHSLPGFDESLITLLAISHSGYLIDKIPTRGVPARDAKAGKKEDQTTEKPKPAPQQKPSGK